VRQHDSKRNAQAVWAQLFKGNEMGTNATVSSRCRKSKTLSATTKLIVSWKQSIVSFLNKILDLETLTDKPTDDDQTKRNWLETSIIGHAAMTDKVAHLRSTEVLLD
jgi:hypothetical protein